MARCDDRARRRADDVKRSERKPVAEFTVEQAFSRFVARTAPWLQRSQRPEEIVDNLRIELGYPYNSSLGTHSDPRITAGMPGSRAPHLWLTRSSERVSMVDLAGDFMLLVGAGGGNWTQAAAEAAGSFPGLPLNAYCVGKDFGRSGATLYYNLRTSSQGASFVRPDGFIAWRSPDHSVDCSRVLRGALAESLGVS